MDFAISTIELANINQIKTDLKNPVLSEKFIKKYYQVIAKHVKYFNEKAKKLNEATIALEFSNQESPIKSIKNAIFAAWLILDEIKQFNATIPKNIGVLLQVKVGVSLNSGDNIAKFTVIERKIAKPFNLIVSKAIYNKVSADFEYEIIGPVPVKDEMVKFYKIVGIPEIETIKQQQKQTQEPAKQKAETNPEPKQTQEEQTPPEKTTAAPAQEESKLYSISQAVNGFASVLKPAPFGKIIGISGQDGFGKTTVLNKAYQQISPEMNTLWVKADCSKSTTSEPFGVFRDLLKAMLSIPCHNINMADVMPVAQKNLEVFYQITDTELTFDVCSILVGQPNKITENIYANKKLIFDAFLNIFNKITEHKGLTFIIEDVDFADKISIECLNYLVQNDILKKSSIILTYTEETDVRTFLNPLHHDPNSIYTVPLAPPDEQTYADIFANLLNNQEVLSPNLKQKIINNSKGNLLYISEIILYFIQTNLLYVEDNNIKAKPELEGIALPPTIETLFDLRLNILEKNKPDSIKLLLYASLLGYKFMPQIINNFLGYDQEAFVKELQYVGMSGLIISIDNFNCVFKHKILWDLLYKKATQSELSKEINAKFCTELSKISNNESIKIANSAHIAGYNQEYEKELSIVSKEAFLLGDVYNYTEAQKTLIEIFENSLTPDKEATLAQMYENIGIMNINSNPNDAVNYLSSSVVLNERLKNPSKVIDLAGYLAKSCELIGNYSGSIECADKALALVDKEKMPIEYSLLVYSKLESLFYLGLYEEVNVLAQNEVIPILSGIVDKQVEINGLSNAETLIILLNSELILAKSLAYQGNVLCLDVTKMLEERSKVFNQHSFLIEAKIVESTFKALQGLTNEAKEILNIIKESAPHVVSSVSWNFAKFLAGFISKDEANMINDGVKTLQIAEKEKDFNTHVIVKSLIGKIYKDIGNYEKAQETYISMLEFATRSKLATPALLIWYLSSELSAAINDFEEAEAIINNAMPIAERPNINNYLMQVLLTTIQADVELSRNNFDIAKIKIETNLKISSEFKLYLLESTLYLQYAKLFVKMALTNEINRQQNMQTAYNIYNSTLERANSLENIALVERVQRELQALIELGRNAGVNL